MIQNESKSWTLAIESALHAVDLVRVNESRVAFKGGEREGRWKSEQEGLQFRYNDAREGFSDLLSDSSFSFTIRKEQHSKLQQNDILRLAMHLKKLHLRCSCLRRYSFLASNSEWLDLRTPHAHVAAYAFFGMPPSSRP